MDNKYHEHKMVRVDYPAVAFAKRVCVIAMLMCAIILGIYYTSSPAIKQMIIVNQYWIVGVLGGIVGIVFVRALLQAFSR